MHIARHDSSGAAKDNELPHHREAHDGLVETRHNIIVGEVFLLVTQISDERVTMAWGRTSSRGGVKQQPWHNRDCI
ncbi:NADPH-dependent 7-cyano-7-deazaguanine reductase [Sesbania bispinosa]|nr:NADPH-dependent 7-cyano-7-deazaguanine reductase [Sesbania bispinosa]